MQFENGLFTSVFPPGFTGDPVEDVNFWGTDVLEKLRLNHEAKEHEKFGETFRKILTD